VLDTVKELGIGFVPYSPLGRGLLTGAVDPSQLKEGDFRGDNPRWSVDYLQHNLGLVEKIKAIAEEKGVKPSQLALAWVVRDQMVPIPGTRRIRYLEENVAAAEITLTETDRAALDAAVPAGAAAGDRYAPAGMASLNH
jgi:aryl-alcohol dehydrogenase-like predicted oxidoreductase